MAGNARFHDKLHRSNHHTLSTDGFLDSATDPIASHEHPFQGDFVVNGVLSSNTGIDVISANFVGDVYCENMHANNGMYANFISGGFTETIISDGALTGYGDNTLTLDFTNGIYLKSPISNFLGNVSSVGSVYSDIVNTNSLNVSGNGIFGGDLLVTGNLSALGEYSLIETNIIGTSALSVINHGSNTALTIDQFGDYPIAVFQTNDTTVLSINSGGLILNGSISATGNIESSNISILESASSLWDSSYNSLTSTSADWDTAYDRSVVFSETSALYDSSYNSLTSTSANWDTAYQYSTVFSETSSLYDSSYNSLTSTSGNWNTAYDRSISFTETSGLYDSSYNTLTSTSGNWDSVFTSVSSTSSNWNIAYDYATEFSNNSGSYDSVYNTVNELSSEWNIAYTFLTSNSAEWQNSVSLVESNSSSWDFAYNFITQLSSVTGLYDSTFNLVSSTSSYWNDSYNVTTSISSVYNTVSANSATWLSGSLSNDYNANNLTVNNSLTTNSLKVRGSTYYSVSTITTTTSAQLVLNSPTFWFINPNGTNPLNVYLPTGLTTSDAGLYFYFKNTFSGGGSSDMNINNDGSTIVTLAKTGQTPNVAELIWDGSNWQTIFSI